MNAKYVLIKQKYEQNQPRERLLILGAILAGIYLLWDLVLLLPLQNEHKKIEAKIEVENRAITKAKAELQVLSGLAKKDPSVTLNKEILVLQSSLENLDEQLSSLSHALIPADQLAIMIHDVLKANKNLTLVNLKTRPTEKVRLHPLDKDEQSGPEGDEVSQDQGDNTPRLYKHGVDLTFKGKFLEAINYIEALESIKWQFYWDHFAYRVDNYPNAEVSLRVFTLSGGKGIFESE